MPQPPHRLMHTAFITLLKYESYKLLHHGSYRVDTWINHLKSAMECVCTNMLTYDENIRCNDCINPMQLSLASCTQYPNKFLFLVGGIKLKVVCIMFHTIFAKGHKMYTCSIDSS
jgi:hypothetical protein